MKFARSWLLVCLSCLAVAGHAEELRFAPEADYGPFVFADARGQVKGLSVDLLHALAPLGGFQVRTLAPQSLHEILAAAQRGEVELISSLRPTAERSRFLGFTEPYVNVPAVLVLPPGQKQRVGLQALSARPVGVGRGYAVEGFVRERFPAVRWVGFDDDHRALQAMMRGEVDGVVADLASLHFLSQRREPAVRYEVHEHVGFEYPLSFAYPLARVDIGERLTKALHALPTEQRRNIVQHWIPEGRFVYEDPRMANLRLVAVLSIATGVAGLLVLIKARNRGVRRDEA